MNYQKGGEKKMKTMFFKITGALIITPILIGVLTCISSYQIYVYHSYEIACILTVAH